MIVLSKGKFAVVMLNIDVVTKASLFILLFSILRSYSRTDFSRISELGSMSFCKAVWVAAQSHLISTVSHEFLYVDVLVLLSASDDEMTLASSSSSRLPHFDTTKH